MAALGPLPLASPQGKPVLPGLEEWGRGQQEVQAAGGYSAGTSSSLLLDPESPVPLSPNPTLSENLQQRKVTKKPSSAFLVTVAAPPEVASSPRTLLKWSVFGHTQAQTQLVGDISSPLPYRDICFLF